jgi:SAM-dependent methyltransferase
MGDHTISPSHIDLHRTVTEVDEDRPYGPTLRSLRAMARRHPRLLSVARRAKELARVGTAGWPPIGLVRFGDLRRLEPFGRNYGYDRGRPIDRYYIENFLEAHASDVRGRVLEIGDDSYTRRFGSGRVADVDVLDVSASNPRATIVADLTSAPHVPDDRFDCIILVETLQLIYDIPAALRTLDRILKPGGVLLATFPGISQFTRRDAAAWTYYWGLTSRSARRLFTAAFPGGDVEIEAFGNVLAATAFLFALCDRDLRPVELDQVDPDYELEITARVVQRHAGASP